MRFSKKALITIGTIFLLPIGIGLLLIIALVISSYTQPRWAHIYPHADSTIAAPAYVLLVSKSDLSITVPLLPPLYEEYFKLVGRKNFYKTGEFSWLLNNHHDQPKGSIVIDWKSRTVAIGTTGIHLYNGVYREVSISSKIAEAETKSIQ